MKTLPELQNIHEEVIQICGNLVTLLNTINDDEPPVIVDKLQQCTEVARVAILGCVACLDAMMEKKREAE